MEPKQDIRYIGLRFVRWTLIIALLLGCIVDSDAARRKRRKRKATTQTTLTTPISEAKLSALDDVVAGAIRHGEKLLGKPYRTGGIAPWPLDCSGYVSYIFSRVGISIPRSSSALSTFTDQVKEPQPGDLVFFKGRNASSRRVGHVALVVDRIDDDLVIMHSTNSRGIIKHRLSRDAYFSSRYLFAGRIPELSERIAAMTSHEGGDHEPRLSPLAPEPATLPLVDHAPAPALPEWAQSAHGS